MREVQRGWDGVGKETEAGRFTIEEDQLWSQDRGRERRGEGFVVEVGDGGTGGKVGQMMRSSCAMSHRVAVLVQHMAIRSVAGTMSSQLVVALGFGSLCLRNAWALIRVRQQGKLGERDLRAVQR